MKTLSKEAFTELQDRWYNAREAVLGTRNYMDYDVEMTSKTPKGNWEWIGWSWLGKTQWRQDMAHIKTVKGNTYLIIDSKVGHDWYYTADRYKLSGNVLELIKDLI